MEGSSSYKPFVEIPSKSGPAFSSPPSAIPESHRVDESLLSLNGVTALIEQAIATYVEPNVRYLRSTAESAVREYGLNNVELVWNKASEFAENFRIEEALETLVIYALRAAFLPFAIGLSVLAYLYGKAANLLAKVYALYVAVLSVILPAALVAWLPVIEESAGSLRRFAEECFDDLRYGTATKTEVWNRVIGAAVANAEALEVFFDNETVRRVLQTVALPTWLRMLAVEASEKRKSA